MCSAAQAVCVYCRRQAVEARWRPFCSERCKTADLAAWATGAYSVPVEHVEPEESEEPDPEPSDERSS
jgi:endogenous inhibitor of DNA gyrase (YacG/DUF329 family)